MVVGNGCYWQEDVLLWLHWAFLVLRCNPDPLLVWRGTPLWVGYMCTLHLGLTPSGSSIWDTVWQGRG